MDVNGDGSEHGNKSTLASRLGISVEKLDFEHIKTCQNAGELEKILKVLRSGEEGCFPELERKTEEMLNVLKPKSRLLRKEEFVLKSSDLKPEESSAVKEDLSKWLHDMSLKDQQLKQGPPSSASSQPAPKELPPVRKANANAIKTSAKEEAEVVSSKPSQKAKPSAPRNYREWDKIVSKIDTEVEAPDSSAPSPAVQPSATTTKLRRPTELKESVDSTGMSDLQKEQLSALEKDKGNEALKAGSFAEAAAYYSRSISILPTVAAHNNRALAYIKLEKWSDAIGDCDYVLTREGRDIKALLRRATALKGQQKYTAAQADIDVVLALEPNNKQAQDLLASISKHITSEDSRRKAGVPRRMVIEETDGEESDDESSSTPSDRNESGGSVMAESTELLSKSQEPSRETASVKSNKTCRGAEVTGDLPSSTESVPDSLLSNMNPKENSPVVTDLPVKIFVAPLPSNVAALSSKAGVLFKAGQYGDAKALYDQAITALDGGDKDLDPMRTSSYHLSSLYSNRAACYFKIGDPRNCISDCSASLQLVPHSPKPLLRRAQAFEQLEKYADAYVDYRHYLSRIAVERDAGDVNGAQQGASRCQACLQQLHGSAWRDRIPKIPSVSNLLAYEFESSTDESLKRPLAGKTQGLMAASESLTGAGEPAKRYFSYDSAKNEGNEFYKQGNYQEAIKCYTAGITLAPDQAVCYSNRAECYLKLSQPQRAAEDAESALRCDPDNEKALFRYARACKEIGLLSKSRELLERLLQQHRNNKEAQKELQAVTQALSAKESQCVKIDEIINKKHQGSSANSGVAVGTRVNIAETSSDESDTETAPSSAEHSSSEGSERQQSSPDDSIPQSVDSRTASKELRNAFNDKPDLGSPAKVPEVHREHRSAPSTSFDSASVSQSPAAESSLHKRECPGMDSSCYQCEETAETSNSLELDYDAVKEQGRKLVSEGNFQKALELYSEGIRKFGADSVLHNNRAFCHLRLEHYVEAVADCNVVLHSDPKNVKALFRLGRAEKCRGNYQNSLKVLKQALQFDKSNKEIAQEVTIVTDLYRKHLETLKNGRSTSATCNGSSTAGLDAYGKAGVNSSSKKLADAATDAACRHVGTAHSNKGASTTSQSRADETTGEQHTKDSCPLSHRKHSGKLASTIVNAGATNSCGSCSVRTEDTTNALGGQASPSHSTAARKPLRVTPASFVQEWHRVKSPKGTQPYADLLRKIPPGDIPEAITNQIDGDMLSKVVSTLKDHFISCGEDSKTAYDILENISRVSRFNMAKEFLSQSDRRNLDDIMKAFTHFGIRTSATLRQSYSL